MPDRPVCKLYDLKQNPIEIHNHATTNPQELAKMVNGMIDELESEGALYPIDKDDRTLKPVRIK